MSQIASKIFYNTAWQIVLRVFEVGLGIVTLGLITRYLGQAEFGYYTTVIAWLTFFITLIDLGLYLTALREISAQATSETARIINNILSLRIVSSLAFLLVGVLAVQFTAYPIAIKHGVAAASFSYFFISLVTILTALFQKHLDMPKIAFVNVINKLLFFIFVVCIIFYYQGSLQEIFYATSLASFFYFLVTWIFTNKYLKLRLTFDKMYWAEILRKTWPIAVTTALNLIYFKLDTLILSWSQSASEVGLYGATYRVLEIVATFPHMFMGLILPLFTAAWLSKNIEELRNIWQRSFDFFSFLTLPMIGGTFVVATPLMIVVAGPEFAATGPILKILIIATAAIFFGTLFTYMVLALERQREMIKYFAIAALAAIIGYSLFIPAYSYWGAAWVTVVVEWLIVAFAWLVIRKDFRYRPRLTAFWKLCCATLLMVAFLLALPQVATLPKIALGILVYLAFTFILRTFTVADIKRLARKNV